MTNEVRSVSTGLTLARQVLSHCEGAAFLEGEVLLASLLDKPRSWVLAHPEAEISPEIYSEYENHLKRLAAGEPLPYLTGRQEFYGLEFEVSPQVLIPRSETELLVDQAIEWLRAHPGRRNGADAGTGSGCIAVSLLVHISDLHLTASDISSAALELASKNMARFSLVDRCRLVKTNLLDGMQGPLDLICANLPYIPSSNLDQLVVAKYEPRLALDGGSDGLDLVRELFRQARTRLAVGGLLLAEIEARQGTMAAQAARHCFPGRTVQVLKDLAGFDRLIKVS